MRPTYGVLDLFTLVAKMLAPFVDPLRVELATRPVEKAGSTLPPASCVDTLAGSGLEGASTIATNPAEVGGATRSHVAGCGGTCAETLEIVGAREEKAVRTGFRSVKVRATPAVPAVVADRLTHRTESSDTHEPDATVKQGETLFTRKKAGRQWRYHVAQADAPGPKFRRLTAGKRVRYEPAR